MAVTYTWAFPQFDCAPSEDGMTDVVKTIHWSLTGSENGYSCNVYGTVALSSPNPDSFVPYDQITEQWAVDAVTSSEGFDLPAIEANIAGNIAAQQNPPVVPLPPPF